MFDQYPKNKNMTRDAITNAYRADETKIVEALLRQAELPPDQRSRINKTATQLVTQVRQARKKEGGIDAFMQLYDLSSEEGIALMCVAEALLRIPDKTTIDRLLQDKIGMSDWKKYLGASQSTFVNAATWSLMLTGKIYRPTMKGEEKLSNTLSGLFNRSGGVVIRKAVKHGMELLGKQFVMGRTIDEALKRAKKNESKGYTYSYDMLGEAAYTQADADRYFDSYVKAIEGIGKKAAHKDPRKNSGISVKLSAIHPRYELAKRDRLMKELVPKLKELALMAKAHQIGLTVDAEESYRLEISLDILEAVFSDPALDGWEGFGLAVQAYQKRAYYVIDWLAEVSRRVGRRWMVRLVKGAYWDTEIKLAQVLGLSSYPVFTRKNNTDVSYIACAKQLLQYQQEIYPQFATHNAHSLATVLELAKGKEFECQCLHGMGAPLYDQVVGKDKFDVTCRIYAPVGSHEDLLSYLVRRLLENGANTSFVNRITDEKEPVEKIIEDPVLRVNGLAKKPHPYISLPEDLYGNTRKNSMGIDITNIHTLHALGNKIMQAMEVTRKALPTLPGYVPTGEIKKVVSPTNLQHQVGTHVDITESECEIALEISEKAQRHWDRLGVLNRAEILERVADLFETHKEELMAIAIYEAGKTIPDAIAEVREAVDFCRYYAEQARKHLVVTAMPGPTGELNQLYLNGRGVILCISPWNFPLAIFTGQVVAALVAGNTVLAKPAEFTPLIAARAVELMHEAGIPKEVVQLVPGRGSVIGNKLVADERVKGVMFTGSTETAHVIQQTLTNRKKDIVPFVAETGGQNTMIVDSSALPEQVVFDVVTSAFGSAGQRCSALRVLFLQEDVADKIITMLIGAMKELKVGDPSYLDTDIGPVIDEGAQATLQAHFDRMSKEATLLYQVPLDPHLKGTFFAPALFELHSIDQLTREVFGPILHIVRYSAKELDTVMDAINSTGYGLTFGIHSRINETVAYLQSRIKAGNTYVNRNMIGAVVGVQPFGGEGLSGTGPKAGGPHYLPRLCVERTVSINTAAAGGNASLLSLAEDD